MMGRGKHAQAPLRSWPLAHSAMEARSAVPEAGPPAPQRPPAPQTLSGRRPSQAGAAAESAAGSFGPARIFFRYRAFRAAGHQFAAELATNPERRVFEQQRLEGAACLAGQPRLALSRGEVRPSLAVPQIRAQVWLPLGRPTMRFRPVALRRPVLGRSSRDSVRELGPGKPLLKPGRDEQNPDAPPGPIRESLRAPAPSAYGRGNAFFLSPANLQQLAASPEAALELGRPAALEAFPHLRRVLGRRFQLQVRCLRGAGAARLHHRSRCRGLRLFQGSR